jgi:hypothetical protein
MSDNTETEFLLSITINNIYRESTQDNANILQSVFFLLLLFSLRVSYVNIKFAHTTSDLFISTKIFAKPNFHQLENSKRD